MDRQEFRRLLLDERRRLAGEIAVLAVRAARAGDAPAPGGGDDDALADAAAETIERDRDSAVETSLRTIMEEIDQALRRLRTGTYGTCVRCGYPINPHRLRAIPYATLCVACKAAQERGGGLDRHVPFREWRVLKTTWGADDDEDGQK
ncbi:MAG: TraR/DksA C4-type zinc finger protein [Armatimonadota bacterium]|nr:TraR/DksA C4-type zinc finger protein [Armatimonadota bacterium]